MPKQLASEVGFQEESAKVRQIPAAPTAVTGAIVLAERGPIDTQVTCQSFEEYTKNFGGATLWNKQSYLAVKGFYEGNPSGELHVVRTVHHSDITNPASKTSAKATLTLKTASLTAQVARVDASISGPYVLVPGDHLDISVSGGGAVVATIAATAGASESGVGTYAITNGQNITVKVDGGSVQTIAFLTAEFVSIGAATAAELAAVINSKIVGAKASLTSGGTKVTITSDRKGSGSSIQVTGGTANGAIAFGTSVQSGTGNVSNVSAVTAAEVAAIVLAAVGGTITTGVVSNKPYFATVATGVSATIQVTTASTANDEIGLDSAVHTGVTAGAVDTLTIEGKSDGTYGNSLKVKILPATNGDSASFNLSLEQNGIPVENRYNLNLNPTSPKYILTEMNNAQTGSQLVTVLDLLPNAPSPYNVPIAGTFGPLTGGNDGLTSLDDNDFIGASSSSGKTALRCLDLVSTLRIVGIPGRQTASVHNALITYCEITREGKVFPVLVSPMGYSKTQVVNYFKNVALLQNLSEFGAFYWPNIKVDNPNKTLFGQDEVLVADPTLHIAAAYARNDAKSIAGVWQHPAGVENGVLVGARGVEMEEVKDKAARELVFPELINPVSIEEGTPVFLDGARCCKAIGNWPTIGERRGVIFTVASLETGLRFMRHRNINERLYQEGFNAVDTFLLNQTRNEAFASKKASEAYTVDFGKGLNPPSVAFARTVVGAIALATSKPAEFILIKISPDQRALQAELAAAALA